MNTSRPPRELVDGDGYPTPAALDRIDNFEGTPIDLTDFVSELWWPGGRKLCHFMSKLVPDTDEVAWEWYLATGGWSGNEEIISHLEGTFFWMKFWYSHVRGGGFTFYLPEPDAHRVEFWGNLQNYPGPASP